MKIAIVSNIDNGVGLQKDYELLKAFLERRGHDVTGVHWLSDHKGEYDLCIFLETMVEGLLGLSKRLWYFPNPEWLRPQDERIMRKHIEKVFAKTHAAYDSLSKKFTNVHYVGFMAEDRMDCLVPRKRQFLHIGGNGACRNTSQVLEAWRSCRYWEGVPEDLPLIIVSRNADYKHEDTPGVTRNKRLDDTEIKRLQNESMFHLMPSATEGYGHAIHEALSVGALLITTDAPPMNEIKTAFFVPSCGSAPCNNATLYEVNPADIREACNAAAEVEVDDILGFSKLACEEFERGNEEFGRLFLPHLTRMRHAVEKPVIAILGNFVVPWCTEQDWAWSFESLGHRVLKFQENTERAEDVLDACKNAKVDLFCYVHSHGFVSPGEMSPEDLITGLRAAGIVTVSPHLDLYFGLNISDGRDASVGKSAYWKTDYVITADGSSQEKFRDRGVNHVPMMPGVVARDCYEGKSREDFKVDVGFCGAGPGYHAEWPWRGEMIRALQDAYGNRFRQFNGIRGRDLNDLYASVKVLVADCCFAGKPYYISDRWPETCGRGGFLLAPQVEGVCIPLATFKPCDAGDMIEKIDYYLEHEQERELIRRACHEHVKNHDTYTHRARQILKIAGLS